jgi:hypothetical protein
MSESKASASGDPDHHFAPPSPPSNTDYRHARWPRLAQPASSSPASLDTAAQPAPTRATRARQTYTDPRRIVVVGVCSSGKSTLVRSLRERGYNARAVSQEHSYVPYLWQRSRPDVLVYLDASVHTIRARGRPRWRPALLDVEHERLSHAREHADLYIPTDGLAPEDVASRVVTFLSKQPSA